MEAPAQDPEQETATDDAAAAPAVMPDEPEHEEPAAVPEEPAALPDGSNAEGAVLGPAAPESRTVSQVVARRLHEAGARFCFTVPGESFLPLLDDLAEVGIRVVTTRHEGGAAFMAEALAQSTGRPAVVLVTRTVGAANAAIGIHTAHQDSAPVVTLVGQVQRSFLGREAFQESDLVRGIGSLAAWAGQVDDPARVGHVMDQALARFSQGRPGPVLISLPEDILGQMVEVGPAHESPTLAASHAPRVDRAQVRRILKWLAASERGAIVAGGGVLRARATKRLVALSEALAIPVIASWRRPDVFPNDHEHYLGMSGYWAAPTVRERLLDADAVLFIGCRLSEVATYDYAIPSPSQSWGHVDLQPRVAHAGLSAPDHPLAADAARFLDMAWSDLRGAALDAEMRSRREARIAADREAFLAASHVGRGFWEGPGVHPGHLVEIMSEVLPDNAVITTDAGNMAGWAARGYRFKRPGTFIGPTSGAMGFGLPAALAASLRDPDRVAVAMCGDGGLVMTVAELETAVREGAHPVVIVLDNRLYGTIAMHQRRAGRGTGSSRLGPIDFAALARSLGALGLTVIDDASFEPALREAIAARRAAVIHVTLDPVWVSVDDNPVSGAGVSL